MTRGEGGAMRDFYWLIDGVLAGCGRPGKRRRGRPAAEGAAPAEIPADDPLDTDLAFLRRQGIGAVLSLTEEPLTPAQLDRALDFIDGQRARGNKVAVHCLMGQGRTGTVLAAYLIRGGVSPATALRELRSVCPDAVGAAAQERFLHDYAARRAWIV